MRTNQMITQHDIVYTAVRRGLCLLLSAVLLMAATGPALAQTGTLRSIAQNFDAYRSKALQEKLYLHLDRLFYACGETMWFKVYNTDGALHKPLDLSKVAYVEVLDEGLKPVLQGKIALKDGTGNGSFVLPVSLNSGNYKVRAYTSWMKNFGPEFYFETPVTVVNSFTSLSLAPVQDTAAYAVQFFPEGGNLVQGIAGKVAFQGINKKTGKGIDFTGKVIDNNGVEVAQFRSHKFGIGQFTFTPAASATYTALIELPNKQVLRQKLPQVYEQGYSLHLEEYNADQLQLTVAATGQQPESVHLLGHARQIVGVAESAGLQQGTATFVVDKSKLAEGINHFTVFNSQQQPVCERLYFKRPTQMLHIDAKTDKGLYTTREKVTTNLLTQVQAGQAVSANMSVSVYKLDSLQGKNATDIYSYLWLTSDLKGTVEQPGYYFTASGPEVDEAVDNLMLTHGWSRFRWEDVLQEEQNTNYKFLPEYDGHFIRGKATDAETGAIARNITTYLTAPGKHVRFYSATSDKDGLMQFEAKDFYGSKEIVVQSNFLKDSTYHFEIFSPFSDKYAARPLLAFNIAAHLQQELTQRHIGVQVPYSYHGKHLNVYRAPGIDSTAFYGKADATYLLDDYVRFKVMEEVMREYVPGVQVRLRRGSFHFNVLNSPNSSLFFANPLVLLDGVPVFDIDKIMAFDPRKVRKLEVFTRRYFHGPHVYTGLVSYTTYQGDLAGFQLDPRSLLMEYEGLQLQREFYAPSYDSEQQRQNRLPDFRNLLHWSPDVVTKADGKTSLSFFTSDEAGKYMIVVQGMTKSGLSGSKAFTFEVRQQPL